MRVKLSSSRCVRPVASGCSSTSSRAGAGWPAAWRRRYSADELGVIGVHEVGQPAADELGRARRRRRVRRSARWRAGCRRARRHRLVHRLEQPAVDALALGARRASRPAGARSGGRRRRRSRRRCPRPRAARGARRGRRSSATACRRSPRSRTLPHLARAPHEQHGQHARPATPSRISANITVSFSGLAMSLRPRRSGAASPARYVLFCHARLPPQHSGTGRAHPPDSP